MNNASSAYPFPIFISSAVYNLIDLRAELKNYLDELGYDPYLSDGEGFHSSTPELSPYESCLKVLSTSFIMILVIDGKYGKKLKWPYWEKIIGGREVSPTHGEYLFANNKNMRMLVFIRQEVLNNYQVYLNVIKEEGDNKKVNEILNKAIPKYIDIDTLQFIHEVKNNNPIPWVKGFKDITDIKKDLKSNMVNELAQLFLIKTQQLEHVTIAFAKTLEKLSSEERIKVLKGIGVTNELIQQIELQGKRIIELEQNEEKLKVIVKEKSIEIEKLDGKLKKDSKKDIKYIDYDNELNRIKELLESNRLVQENLLYGTVTTFNKSNPALLNQSNIPKFSYSPYGLALGVENLSSYPSGNVYSTLVNAAKEVENSSVMRAAKEVENSSVVRAAKEVENSPLVKSVKEAKKKYDKRK